MAIPEMLRKYNIPMSTIISEIRAGHIREPAGKIDDKDESRITYISELDEVEKLKELKMTSIVCTNNINTTRASSAMSPDYVAVEPPELIGSGIPVSKAQPGIITGSVEAVKEINSGVGVLSQPLYLFRHHTKPQPLN